MSLQVGMRCLGLPLRRAGATADERKPEASRWELHEATLAPRWLRPMAVTVRAQGRQIGINFFVSGMIEPLEAKALHSSGSGPRSILILLARMQSYIYIYIHIYARVCMQLSFADKVTELPHGPMGTCCLKRGVCPHRSETARAKRMLAEIGVRHERDTVRGLYKGPVQVQILWLYVYIYVYVYTYSK